MLRDDALRLLELVTTCSAPIDRDERDQRRHAKRGGDEPDDVYVVMVVTAQHRYLTNLVSQPPSKRVTSPMIGEATATYCISAATNSVTSTTTASSDAARPVVALPVFSSTRRATARPNSSVAVPSATNTEPIAIGTPA